MEYYVSVKCNKWNPLILTERTQNCWGGIKLQSHADSTMTFCKFELKAPSQNSVLSIGNGCIYVCTCFWNGLQGYRPNSW